MVWYNPRDWLNESIKAFKSKSDYLTDKQQATVSGEGYESFDITGFGSTGLSSFNMFYNQYINKTYKNEVAKIYHYRNMVNNPEISDVVEDAVNESLQEDTEGYIINFKVSDESISNKESLMKNINNEFYNFFYNKLNIEESAWNIFYDYFVDGRVYLENIINVNRPKEGIIGWKRLPSETMDRMYDEFGRIEAFLQYLSRDPKKPKDLEDAERDDKIIVFYPEQITFIPYQYGQNRNIIYGFLEKCKIPYNQLKLLETAMVIYRIVRAPERFVFKIDTGAMPRDKAMKYVEKVKQKMNKKQTFDPNTGTLQNSSSVLSLLDNYFLPQSDNRGSDISTVGGSSKGFESLDDIFYFQKKLYRALKYPMSRVENKFENRTGDNLFHGNAMGEITRDEIKWSKFLERQQKKIADNLKELFLLHLKFKNLKDTYGLTKDNFQIHFNDPSNYKSQMDQMLLETRINNYMHLSNEEGFSKFFLMKHYLNWDEETIKENAEGIKKDKELGLVSKDGMGF